jgi:hypothetical protein
MQTIPLRQKVATKRRISNEQKNIIHEGYFLPFLLNVMRPSPLLIGAYFPHSSSPPHNWALSRRMYISSSSSPSSFSLLFDSYSLLLSKSKSSNVVFIPTLPKDFHQCLSLVDPKIFASFVVFKRIHVAIPLS